MQPKCCRKCLSVCSWAGDAESRAAGGSVGTQRGSPLHMDAAPRGLMAGSSQACSHQKALLQCPGKRKHSLRERRGTGSTSHRYKLRKRVEHMRVLMEHVALSLNVR